MGSYGLKGLYLMVSYVSFFPKDLISENLPITMYSESKTCSIADPEKHWDLGLRTRWKTLHFRLESAFPKLLVTLALH